MTNVKFGMKMRTEFFLSQKITHFKNYFAEIFKNENLLI